MRVVTKCKGKVSEHDINTKPTADGLNVTAIVHQQNIKVEAPDADVIVTPDTTRKTMAEMSEKAWKHISTGGIFPYLFNKLFENEVEIPATRQALMEDYDEGVIHAAGMIVQLVEAKFAGAKTIFLKTPESSLHPRVCYHLMSVISDIQKIGPSNMEVKVA